MAAGDIEENIEITVTGADELEKAAAAARELEERLDAARSAMAELDAAGEGAESAAEALSQAADAAEAFSRSADSARDALAEIGTASAGTEEAAAAMDEAAASAQALAESADEAAAATAADATAAADAAAANDALGASYAGVMSAVAAYNAESNVAALDQAAAAETAAKATGNLRDDSIEAGIGVEFLAKAISSFRDKSASLDAAALALDISLEGVSKTAKSARDALVELGLSEGEAAAGAAALASAMTAVAAVTDAGDVNKVLGGIAGMASSMPAFAAGALVAAPAIGAIVTELAALGTGATAAIDGLGAFGLLALPTLEKIKTAYTNIGTARAAYRAASELEARDPTTANLTAQAAAAAKLKIAWADMSPSTRTAIHGIDGLKREYLSMAKAFEPDAMRVFNGGLKLANTLLPDLKPLAKDAAGALNGLLGQADKFAKSAGFKNWLKQWDKLAGPAITSIGQGIGHVAIALGKLGTSFSPQDIRNAGHVFATVITGMIDGVSNLSHHMMQSWDLLSKIGRGIAHTTEATFDPIRDLVTHPGLHSVEQLFGLGGKPAKIPVYIVPKVSAADMAQLDKIKAEFQGKGGSGTAAKLTTGFQSIPVKADTSKLAGQINDAAKQVQVHGLTVSLANAKLSGMAALSGTMATAGRAAGRALDTGLASAIQSGAASDTSAARGIAASIRGALSGLPGQMHSVGVAAADGLAAGIRAGTGSAVSAAQQMASAVEQAARTHLQTQSPSKVFRKIGAETVAGFIQGLEGGKKQVRAAMADILGHPVNDLHISEVIAKMRREVEAAFGAGTISAAQDSAFTAYLRQDNQKLQDLARQRTRIEEEIKAADALAKTVRDAAEQAGSVVSAFGETYNGQAPVAPHYKTIQGAMRAQLEQTRQFRKDIEKLKKEGLDKASIRQLLREGVTGGLPIAEQLLAGGKGGIKETSRLEEEIRKAAKRLGIVGANAGYESGKHMGQGLAAGLKGELGTIVKEMRKIAEELVKAIKRALKISSPSQVMIDIGRELPAGLVLGMDGHLSAVTAAAERQAMAALAHPAMSRAGGSSGYGGGGYTSLPAVEAHITLHVDGMQLGRTVQKVQLQHARRNTRTGNQLRGRGT